LALIPANIVEQIKSRADVLDVVSEVVQLKQRGRNYFGLCPFHEEKTPSFSVNPAKGIFHCFGCGKGGNAVSFVMEHENIEYVEALKRLAERYGIEIQWEKGAEDFQKGETALLYELHEIAKNYFIKQLFSDKGKPALDYLLNRGFSKEILQQFSVGFVSDEWEGLVQQIAQKRFSAKILEKSGLFIQKENKRFLDRFRNRIMFPIYNISGRVVAFGGRTMDSKEPAKYMNSPETPIYFKSGTLYGLEHSKTAIQQEKSVIIVEGYTDFLRFYASGIQHVIAGSGTALNFHHARVLKRFSSSTVLCYDGDEAGQKATERAGFMLLKEGFDVRVIQLPPEDDPDSYIKNNGAENFRKLYKDAPEFIQYFIQNHSAELKTPTSKTQFIDSIVTEISEVHNPVTRDFIIKEIADKLDLREERILGQLRRFIRQKRSGNISDKKSAAPEIKISTATEKSEYELLKMILSDNDDIIGFIVRQVPLKLYKHPVLSTIVAEIYHRLSDEQDISPAALFDHPWSDQEKLYLSRLIIDAESSQAQLEQEDMLKLVVDCMSAMMTDQLDKSIQDLRSRIKEAEKKQEDTVSLVVELSQLQKKRHDIRSKLRELKL